MDERKKTEYRSQKPGENQVGINNRKKINTNAGPPHPALSPKGGGGKR
jgi:hypothetical protein